MSLTNSAPVANIVLILYIMHFIPLFTHTHTPHTHNIILILAGGHKIDEFIYEKYERRRESMLNALTRILRDV